MHIHPNNNILNSCAEISSGKYNLKISMVKNKCYVKTIDKIRFREKKKNCNLILMIFLFSLFTDK